MFRKGSLAVAERFGEGGRALPRTWSKFVDMSGDSATFSAVDDDAGQATAAGMQKPILDDATLSAPRPHRNVAA